LLLAPQTVLDHVLRSLLSVTAPVAPHLAEDAWLNLPYARPAESVFQAGWAHAPEQWSSGLSQEDLSLWAAVVELREAVNGTLEKARVEKAVGSSLDARVTLHVADTALAQRLRALDASNNGVDELRYLFIVSQADLVADAATVRLAPFSETASAPADSSAPGGAVGEFTVGVSRAAGAKCARCWNYCGSVGASSAAGAGADAHPELCERCIPVIDGLGFKLPAAAGGKEAVAA
jgi:isoleucyl-tRNA synthetase